MRIFLFIVGIVAVILAGCGDDSPSLSLTGDACDESSECESDSCIQELEGCHPFFGCSTYELPGGMCTNVCTWIEDSEATDAELLQADCADTEQCLSVNGDSEASVCFQGCETQEDCREDWVCTVLDGFSTCLPPADAARIIEESMELLATPTMRVSRL